MGTGVRPARPHTGFTAEGKRIREVLSYSRRGSRMGPRQEQAWARHRDRWWIPDEAVDDPAFDLRTWFGREAPLVVEIGSGVGEATAVLAAQRPAYDIVAVEVWRPGVAHTLGLLAEAGAENVRLLSLDAVWCLENLFGPGEVEELWTFFPDPWPKARHHKRRLVGPEFADLVASRLAPGGRWRLATDWPSYAERIRAVLEAHPTFTPDRPDRADRPVTRFEQRGVDAGRPITEFCYRLGEGAGR